MRPALVISQRDNVATALEPLAAGRALTIGGGVLTVRSAIPAGHKVALVDIAAGADVVKYGNPIGTAAAPIAAGDHVHTHNVASARGRGDLRADTSARLAEPDIPASDLAFGLDDTAPAGERG